MLELYREQSPDIISEQLRHLSRYPKNCLRWIESDCILNRSDWILQYSRYWSVYKGDLFCGFMAATDHSQGRWMFHFGFAPPAESKAIFPKAWKTFIQEAKDENCRIIFANIPGHRNDIKRLAKAFRFRQFKNLWAYQLQKHQNRNLSQNLHLP